MRRPRAVRAVGDAARAVLIVVGVLALVFGAALLLARYTDPMNGPRVVGTVVDRARPGGRRYLTIQDAEGNTHRAPVRSDIYRACVEGDAWPACKQVRRG